MASDKKWLEAVQEIKEAVGQRAQFQMYVAKIALEICEVRHGGAPVRSGRTFKTQSRFGRDFINSPMGRGVGWEHIRM